MNGRLGFREELDEEWMELIANAKQIGLTLEQVRTFLRGNLLAEPFLSELRLPSWTEGHRS
ncbi:anti-repressor SinI family protein [Gorillibacterium sp. CAU 1737]|uniref:anti-repressor SinI family protein n=1 Tax=Gorillibacterium sp. CAU 1737 TaxID=3140362 RepID=UPI0032609DAC